MGADFQARARERSPLSNLSSAMILTWIPLYRGVVGWYETYPNWYETAFGIWMVLVRGGVVASVHHLRAHRHESRALLQQRGCVESDDAHLVCSRQRGALRLRVRR